MCNVSGQGDASNGESVEQLRETIRGLQNELIACQRLAVMGSIAGMVTHEFNNLLTPIMARCEAALMMDDDVAFMKKALDRALVQSKRAMTVTRHLLNLVHEDDGGVTDCCVRDAVQEAIETATRPLEKDGIELQLAVPEELQVRAQEDLLCQVLLNLILNARTAMKDSPGLLAISAMRDGDVVQVDVRDSGVGLPPEYLQNTINPFLAADPAERPNDWQQIGLGLNVCRLIARRHHATLEGVANEGRGCTFRLRWPAAD